VPDDIWTILVGAVDCNLSINSTANSKQDSRRKPTSILELKCAYGVIMGMESTYGNDTVHLQQHYLKVMKEYGPAPKNLGMDRFSALLSSLAPSAEEMKRIVDILHETFLAHVDTNTVSNLFFSFNLIYC
jgi:hypothetical protein